MGREEMLNSCGFIKGEITWWHDSWLVIRSGLISSWCHFILEKSHSSLQREQCQNSIKLYLDSQKWNNCSMMDNRKSREMILLIKSWNIRQGVKHRYVLHPNNSCLLFKVFAYWMILLKLFPCVKQVESAHSHAFCKHRPSQKDSGLESNSLCLTFSLSLDLFPQFGS